MLLNISLLTCLVFNDLKLTLNSSTRRARNIVLNKVSLFVDGNYRVIVLRVCLSGEGVWKDFFRLFLLLVNSG